MYCSNACRLRAQRRRRTAGLLSESASVTDGHAEIGVKELLGPIAQNPDEAVLEAVLLARVVAGHFAAVTPFARPEFAWRCDAMAKHVATGIKKYFEP
jgi:hypothetical protein